MVTYLQQLYAERRELRAWMRENRVKDMSVFNGGHTKASLRARLRLDRLNEQIRAAKQHERAYASTPVARQRCDGCRKRVAVACLISRGGMLCRTCVDHVEYVFERGGLEYAAAVAASVKAAG